MESILGVAFEYKLYCIYWYWVNIKSYDCKKLVIWGTYNWIVSKSYRMTYGLSVTSLKHLDWKKIRRK